MSGWGCAGGYTNRPLPYILEEAGRRAGTDARAAAEVQHYQPGAT